MRSIARSANMWLVFWQLSLGMLADAYTLWLLSPIQWHDEWCKKPRCEIARALRNAVAHSEDAGESSLGFQESKNGGLVDPGTSK